MALTDLADDPRASSYFAKAAQYQLVHALALLWLVRSPGLADSRALRLARWGFAVGVVAFSGSLYVLALADVSAWLWPVTPFGGMAFIFGWAALAAGSRRA